MSKIEKLIQKMCPEGIEFKLLSEVFDMRNGYTPSKSNEAYWNSGTINWFRMEDIRANGKRLRDSIQKITPEAVKKGELFKANSIALSTSATIGEHALLEVDCLTNQRFTVFTLKKAYENKVDMTFANYYFDLVDIWCKGHLNQGNFASVDADALKKYEMPIPPLEIQREIVCVLDKFTDIEAMLQEELEARKKQFSFYADRLFLLSSSQKYKLGDVAIIRTGSKPKSILECKTEFEYINAGTTNSGYTEGFNCAGDVVTTPSRGEGGIGFVGYQRDKFWLGPLCYKLQMKCDAVLAKYIYYYLLSKPELLLQYKNTGGVPSLNVGDVAKIEIELPSHDEQIRVVRILDKFHVLCNDLEIGLPAEIEARHKQYEYYRDKLLDFKRKEG